MSLAGMLRQVVRILSGGRLGGENARDHRRLARAARRLASHLVNEHACAEMDQEVAEVEELTGRISRRSDQW